MNTSEKYKLIWWATAGCGSRTTSNVLYQIGIDDMYNHLQKCYDRRGCSFTHAQGIPDGCEEYKIICNTRNPYSRAVSTFTDEVNDEKVTDLKERFHQWLVERYFDPEIFIQEVGNFYMMEWKDIGREPDYIIRMENMEEDIKKLKFINFDSLDNISVFDLIRNNIFKNGSLHDEYIGEFQNYKRFYNQENADLIYGKLKPYFEYFGYDKDSWK
jgi:hypothetical protein